MTSIQRRLLKLETPSDLGNGGRLPQVVPDETTDAELAILRCDGRRAVHRWSEFANQCVVFDSPAPYGQRGEA